MISRDPLVSRLFIAHLVTDLYMPVIPAMLPLLIATGGLTYLAASLLVTAYNLTSALTQPVFGWVADRRGRAIPVGASLLTSAVFISLMGFFSSRYDILVLFAVIAGLGHSSFHPGALTIVARRATAENRGRLTAFFVVGGNLGYAVSPLLVGILLSTAGPPALAVLLVPAVISAYLLSGQVPSPGIPGITGSTIVLPPPAPGAVRDLAILFAASVLRTWAVFAAVAFFPPFLISRGFTLFSANLLVSAMLLCGVAGQLAGGSLSDRYGRKEFVVFGLALSVPAFWATISFSGPAMVLSALILGALLWSSFSVTVAMAHEIMPGQIGLTSGLLIGVALGAGGTGVAVTGAIADMSSVSTALGTVVFLIAGATVLIAILRYPWKVFRHKVTGNSMVDPGKK